MTEVAWPALASAVGLPSSVGAVVLLVSWLFDRRDKRSAAQGQIADQAVQRTLSLVDQLQEELVRATGAQNSYKREIDLYRSVRWQLEERMAELRDAAVAARAMVHDLQRRLGEEATEFPPLPAIGARAPPA